MGSALRAIIFVLGALIKLIASIMVFFGLWAPFFYALLGAALYLAFKFDPFSGSIDSKIYLAGFGGTVLCALLLTIKHLFEKPAESIAEGFKKPIWKKRSEEDEEEYVSRRDYDRIRRFEEDRDEEDYASRRDYGRRSRVEEEDEDGEYEYRSKAERRAMPRESYAEDAPAVAEKPRIYYSAREKDTLIHEYGDRFEVFRVIDGRPVLDKVEYKNL